MKHSLRILTLCYEYPPVGGGGGRVAAQVAAGLVARGHAVRFQTAGMRGVATRELHDGVQVYRTPSFRRKMDTCSVAEIGFFVLTSLAPTLRHIREWKPDVIHAHFAVPTGLLAWLATRTGDVPYVITAHLGDVPGGVPEQTNGLFRFVKPLTRPIWRHAAEITAVSSSVAALAEDAYRRSPVVIFNGMPLATPAPVEIHNPVRIVFVGRMSVQKDPVCAILALSRIADLPWTVDFIGDGPLLGEARSAAISEKVDHRIRFHGWLPSARVNALMRGADVLLLSSQSEGLPMVGVEALMAGLAIVAPNIPGVRDIVIDGENGRLASPPGNPVSLAAALRSTLNPKVLPNYRTASLKLAAHFDINRSVTAYEDLLIRVATLAD